MATFGQYLKQKREEKGLGLRAFCKAADVDASNYSKWERGVLPAPTDKAILKRLARACGIPVEPRNGEWLKFKDQADASHGEIAGDLMLNPRIVALLPALYQHLRDSELPDGGDEVAIASDIIKKVL